MWVFYVSQAGNVFEQVFETLITLESYLCPNSKSWFVYDIWVMISDSLQSITFSQLNSMLLITFSEQCKKAKQTAIDVCITWCKLWKSV